MAIKHIVIPLETEYLQEAAKKRGISRTMLVKVLMNKVINDRLVSDLIGDARIEIATAPKYRRFPPKG